MSIPNSIKTVNLGCGTRTALGWKNIDNSPNARLSKYPLLRWFLWKVGLLSSQHYAIQFPQPLIVRDVRKGLPFSDGSIDYVYASHLLEHLTLGDSHKLAREIFRVLKCDGIARLVVPDLAIGARRYLNSLDANPGNPTAASEFLTWMGLAKPRVRDPHLWMYDAPSLAALLTEAGFVSVTICEFGLGQVPDCDLLDNRPEESLYVEAGKP